MTDATPFTADREFVHSRLINAPPASVFAAISDPARLARWWGPNGFTNTFHQFDFRTGGAWHFTMHGPDGTDHANESLFADIAAPRRVVIEHVSGHHFMLTITLVEQGGQGGQDGQTLVGWHQLFDTAEERARIAPFVVPANEQNLDRLAGEVLKGG